MKQSLFAFLTLFCFATGAWGESMRVRHDHDPWGKCEGELIIGEEGIEYRSPKKESHNRTWVWQNIQSVDRKSPSRLSVLTYEDQKLRLGQDKVFDFELLSADRTFTDRTLSFISDRLKKPVTDRVTEPIDAEYQVPAKHKHALGGCEGTLYFGPETIVYDSEDASNSRKWKKDRDVANVWSANRFELEIRTYEENRRNFDKMRVFRFQLKEPLNQAYYEKLRRELP